MKRFGIVLWYLGLMLFWITFLFLFIISIVNEFEIWKLFISISIMAFYTHLLLKAFVNYYNTFLYDEIIFDDDDDEYFYIELDDNEDGVEKDEDEN